MVDAMGAANLVAAIIEQARNDATAPKLCAPGQVIWIRQDAQDFLSEVVAPVVDEYVVEAVVPLRRRRYAGGLRWEIHESDEALYARRRRQEKKLAGNAGRK